MTAALDTATGQVREVLQLRGELAKSSVEKYEAMQLVAGRDGRGRGFLQFYGAGRTGRFAGRLVQVQNLPRNYLPDLSEARGLVRTGNFEALDLLYDSVPDTLSQLIRTAFIPADGHRFVVAAFSAIEARVIAWLAGETTTLQAFRDGKDLYCETASRMFGVPVDKHGANAELRQKGKIAVLACGYQGGVGALKGMGALRLGLAESELQPLVDAWRTANPSVVQLWVDINAAAIEAFHAPGAGVPASESEQRHFVEVFGEILRLRNLLAGFDEFPDDDDLTPREIQDLQSVYLAVRDELRADAKANEPQPEQLELVFEIELMRQVEVNVDYILMLVEKFREPMLKSQVPDYQYKEQVLQAVESSPTLRDKRDLFMDFIELVNTDASVAEQWVAFISQRREQELGTLIEEERLREPAARDFMKSAFDAGEVPRIGTDIGKVLPRMSFFGNTTGGESRAEVKERVLNKMTEFLERYEPLG